MKNSCETCLFYVDSLPDIVICVAGKRSKEYLRPKNNCKKWVENTPHNAEEQLKFFKEE